MIDVIDGAYYTAAWSWVVGKIEGAHQDCGWRRMICHEPAGIRSISA